MELNSQLRSKLRARFEPMGIVAYSGCCHWGCTGSYDEEVDCFERRDRGVYYIKLYLGG